MYEFPTGGIQLSLRNNSHDFVHGFSTPHALDHDTVICNNLISVPLISNLHITHVPPPSPGRQGEIEPASLLTERAMETIRLLRRELERCQVDLQTDEELFAEKMDELNQLQSAYNRLLREKESLEEMWLTAQENEGLLESEVFHLKEHLTAMTRQLAERGQVDEEKEREKDSLQSDGDEEEDSLREIKPSEYEIVRGCTALYSMTFAIG